MRGETVLLAVVALLAAGPALRAGPAEEAPAAAEVERLRTLAQRFVERGRSGDAERQLVEALSLQPGSTAVLADLLALAEDRPDDLWLWAYHAAGRAADERGRVTLSDFPREARRALRAAGGYASDRARAMGRLAAAAGRSREPAEVRFLLRLARVLSADAPALRAAHAAEFAEAVRKTAPDPQDLLRALARGLDAEGPERVRAAAILRALCTQAKRREEDVHGIDDLAARAARVLDGARGAVEPMTVAELRAIPPADRPAWEEAHADWSNPTVVVTPNGRYRVESVCGVRTTLVVAADIEHQHARLAAWFGRDPFEKQQGVVRVVPSRAELESEGAPYWWASGFQTGPVTAIQAHATNRGAIASLLTHELTHRFDGRVYPLLPGWLVEGRAVHTAACSAWVRAPKLDEALVSFGSIAKAWDDGYWSADALKKLIAGEPEDYRHNYSAGYALWVYLTRRRAGAYGPKVEPYLESFRDQPGLPPLRRFRRFLLDGGGGRARTFDAFAEGFARFVTDARTLGEADWEKEWREAARVARKTAMTAQAQAVASADGTELASPFDGEILDRSNWGRRRDAGDEPAFGEDHAWAAGLWFERNGHPDEAAVAFAWARRVDELTAAQRRHVAEFHRARGESGTAWLWHRGDAPAPAPVRRLTRPLLRVLRALEELERDNTDAGRPRAARAVLADRVRLARAAGLGQPAHEDSVEPRGADTPPPDCPPYECVLADGLVEDRWSPFRSRESGAWHVADGRVLVLGTRKRLGTTTGFRKDAGMRQLFVRTKRRYAGTYTVRARVRLPSAHLSGAIVVGRTRHDRGLVVGLGGGDWAYAVGRKQETAGFKDIHVSLNDLRAYDRGVSDLRHRVRFASPKTSFRIAVRVTGALVRVAVDDEVVLSHRTTTGVPLAGHVGFWLESGLVAFDRPEVRRHRVLGPARNCPCRAHDAPLDFGAPVTTPVEHWPGRRVAGVEPHPLGRLVLVYTGLSGHHKGAAQAARNIWRSRLDDETFARFIAVRPPAPEGELDGGKWEHAMRHHGLPALAARRAKLRAEEAEEFEKNGLDRKTARHRAQGVLRLRPAWAVLDQHGVVRAAGARLNPWNANPAINLLRRLRGY